MTDQMELEDFVYEVRRQLQSAMLEWDRAEPAFKVEEIDLEMQVAVERTREGKIGVTLVADLGAGKSTSVTHTHCVRLKLIPQVLRKGGERPIINDKEPGAQ